MDAVKGVDGDPFALAQPVHQLAVVHSATAEGRLRHIGLTAVFRNLAQDLVVFHRAKEFGPGWWAAADRAVVLPPSAHPWECGWMRRTGQRPHIRCHARAKAGLAQRYKF